MAGAGCNIQCNIHYALGLKNRHNEAEQIILDRLANGLIVFECSSINSTGESVLCIAD